MGIETPETFRNSCAYIQNWLHVLRNDKRFVISAAGKAEKAAKYILGIDKWNKTIFVSVEKISLTSSKRNTSSASVMQVQVIIKCDEMGETKSVYRVLYEKTNAKWTLKPKYVRVIIMRQNNTTGEEYDIIQL